MIRHSNLQLTSLFKMDHLVRLRDLDATRRQWAEVKLIFLSIDLPIKSIRHTYGIEFDTYQEVTLAT